MICEVSSKGSFSVKPSCGSGSGGSVINWPIIRKFLTTDPAPIWQHFFFIGHKNGQVQVGSGSGRTLINWPPGSEYVIQGYGSAEIFKDPLHMEFSEADNKYFFKVNSLLFFTIQYDTNSNFLPILKFLNWFFFFCISGTSRVEAVKRARDIKFMHNMQNKGGVSDHYSTIYHVFHLFQWCESAIFHFGFNADPDPSCGSGMLIPDPKFFHPGSASKYNPKNCF